MCVVRGTPWGGVRVARCACALCVGPLGEGCALRVVCVRGEGRPRNQVRLQLHLMEAHEEVARREELGLAQLGQILINLRQRVRVAVRDLVQAAKI